MSWFCYDAAGERVAKLDFAAGSPSRYTQVLRDGAAVVWEKSWGLSNAVPETQKSYFYAGGRMALTREAAAQAYSAASYLGMLIVSHGGQEIPAPTLGEPQFSYFSAGTHADLSYAVSGLGDDVAAITVRVARVQPSAGHANANANGHSSEQPVFEQTLQKPDYGWPSGAAYLTFPRLLAGWQYQVSLTLETTVGTVPALGTRTVTVEAGSLAIPTGPQAPHAWALHRWVADGQEEDGSPRVAEALAVGWRNVAPGNSGLYTLSVSENGQSVPLTDGPVAGDGTMIVGTVGTIRWCEPRQVPRDLTVQELGTGETTGVTLPRPDPDLCVDPGTGVAYAYTWAAYGTDHLGTVRAVHTENPDGTTGLQTFDYEPFGVEIPGGGTGCGNTHRFTGHERDLETGNDYMHFRYFADSLGRFFSPEPFLALAELQDPLSWNRYYYGKSNPVRHDDPTGLWIPSVDDKGHVIMTWEEGDTLDTLAKALKVDVKDLASLTQGATLGPGATVDITPLLPKWVQKALARQAEWDKNKSKSKPGSEDLNCWTAALGWLRKSVGYPAGVFQPDLADATLAKIGKNIPEEEASYGDLIRQGDAPPGTTTHYSTFFIKDKSGQTWVFSKSGYGGQFHVRTLSSLANTNYGPFQGVGGGSAYYTAK